MGLFDSKPAEQPAPKDYGPAFIAMVDVLDRINEKLAAMSAGQLAAPEVKQAAIRLNKDIAHTYDNHGYKYWGLFLPAAVVVNVNAMGIQYPLSLAQGFNKVVLPPGATIAAQTDTDALAVWSDHLEI